MTPCSLVSFCDLFTAEWLTAIGTVGATVVALVLALREWIKATFILPKLDMDAHVASPNAQLTSWKNSAGQELGGVWYFRLAIENKGNAAARDVQVFLSKVERFNDGKFVAVKRFSPMFLRWSHVGTITTPTLWTSMPRFCDLFHITDPDRKQAVTEGLPGVGQHQGVLALDLEVKPNQQGDLLEPGTYRFTLKLGATNYRPRTIMLRVHFSGLWYPDEETMFKNVEVTPFQS